MKASIVVLFREETVLSFYLQIVFDHVRSFQHEVVVQRNRYKEYFFCARRILHVKIALRFDSGAQQAKLQLFFDHSGTRPRAAREKQTVSPFLKRKGRIHLQCFQVGYIFFPSIDLVRAKTVHEISQDLDVEKIQPCTVDECRQIVDAVKETGLTYMMMETVVYSREFLFVKEMYEKGNVYCASKAAVDAISKTMRIDLLQHRIKVTAIHPGAVETEFALVRFKGDAAKASGTYKGFTPLTGADIAEIIYYTASLPINICINDLVVTPLAQANAIYFKRDLP